MASELEVGNLKATEKVGIGVSGTPSEPLHIDGDGDADILLTRTTANTSGTLGRIFFGGNDHDKYLASVEAYHDGAVDSAALKFTTEQAGTDSRPARLTIDSTGAVSLGPGTAAVTTLLPSLLVTDTSVGGSVTIRGKSPILALDRTDSGTGTILTDGGGLKVKTGTLDGHGSDLLWLKSTGEGIFSGGISFSQTNSSATGATATGTTLSHYEEGTWTPNLLLGGSNTGITFSTQSGTYTRVGNVVNYWFSLALTSKGSQTGVITIDDLPFNNQSAGTGAGNFTYIKNVAGTNWEKSFHLTLGGSDDKLYARYINGTSFAGLADTDITNTTIMYGGGSYITA